MADDTLETTDNDYDFDMESAQSDLTEALFGNSESENETTDDPNLDGEGEPEQQAAATDDPAAAETDDQTQQPAVLEAPKTWRKEAQAQWEALPPTIKQEVLKREEDMFRGIEGYKMDAGIGQTFKQVLTPYLPTLQQFGINPAEHVSELLQANHIMALGSPEQKVELARHLLRQFNIDPELVAGEAPYVDPQVQALQQQLHQLQSFQHQQLQAASQQQRAAIETEVSTFAADPAHPHFEAVSDLMTQLVAGGVAKSLQDAYDRAIWLNPETRQKELDRQTAEKQKQAAQKAEAAKKATSANVRASAKNASGTAPLGSIDDTLKEALAEIRSREEG